MRLTDESALVREAYPERYAEVAVFVTELGGSAGIVLVIAVLYWLTRRRESALVASYAVAGISAVILVKSLLGMPRPPEEVFIAEMVDDPYGFPSGHAFMAVTVYGGLLVTFDRVRDRLAAAGVATLVVAISLSRIVLGFHYLGDVVVGAAMGLAFLLAIHRLVGGEPWRGFALGGLVALPAVSVSGADPYALVGFGAAVGGLVGSLWLEDVPDLRSRIEGAVLSVGGIGFLVAVRSLEAALADLTAVATVALHAVLVAGVLLGPAALGSLEADVLESTRR